MKLSEGITQEDLDLFLQEAGEQIQLLDEDLVKLERDSSSSELMQEIFRAAHTLKGSSGMLGHHRMSELAHAMENVLDNVRKKTLAVSAPVIDALLSGLDVMRLLRDELVSDGAPENDIGAVVAELASVLRGSEVPAAASRLVLDKAVVPTVMVERTQDECQVAVLQGCVEIDLRVADACAWPAVRSFQAIQELGKIGKIVRSVPPLAEVEGGNSGSRLQLWMETTKSESDIRKAIAEVPDLCEVAVKAEKLSVVSAVQERPGPELTKQEITKAEVAPAVNEDAKVVAREEAKTNQTVRVDVVRLDTLMEEVGELVINRNRMSQLCRLLGERYRDDDIVTSLGASLSQITKTVGTLQQDVMAVRMLPIEIVFNTLPRLVRDVARKLDKKVDLVIEGEETEVDRSVIEHLRDPLVHLLRNAIDHGIESAGERVAAGKPESGLIRLSAYHEQDNIVITIRDDGKGIDSEKVKRAAVAKKTVSIENAATMSEADALNLIFASGVSTAQKITDVSGRGVGLDVVKTNVELLNGSVSVSSNVGAGTTFTLRLPLTLAIIPALLVACGTTTCAVPLVSIVESLKLQPSEINTVRGQEVTVFRGSVLPLLRLDEVFGWALRKEEQETTYVIIVKIDNNQVGIAVDALLEPQELVVKSLDRLVGGGNGITGASILGDGRVVLILDVASLVRGAQSGRSNEKAQQELAVTESF